MNGFPSFKTIAGFGVRRGRFHGCRQEGVHWIEPYLCLDLVLRQENPNPGTIGDQPTTSEGVAEKVLPDLIDHAEVTGVALPV